MQRLDEYGISIPSYALVNRDFPDQDLDYFVEEEDYVEVHGKRIMKPFVEKPVDGMILFFLLSLHQAVEVKSLSTSLCVIYCQVLHTETAS